MGGSSKSGTDDWRKEKKAAEAAALASSAAPQQQFPAAMPGQLEAIAAQLGAGYGQDPAAIMAYLQQFAKPMQIAQPTVAGSEDRSASTSSPSSGGNPLGGMSWNDLHPGRPM